MQRLLPCKSQLWIRFLSYFNVYLRDSDQNTQRETETERQKQRDRNRQRDRETQTDRQTDRQTDSGIQKKVMQNPLGIAHR